MSSLPMLLLQMVNGEKCALVKENFIGAHTVQDSSGEENTYM
jgi:hypothetical protein